MSQSTNAIGSIVATAIIASAAGSGAALAGDKKEAYVSPGSNRQALFKGPLYGADGRHVTIEEFTFPPGWIGERHYHTGPVFVYVLHGAFTVSEDGKQNQTFRAGSLYQEPIGTAMQARNSSPTEPVRVLLMQVGGAGEPLMIKAD